VQIKQGFLELLAHGTGPEAERLREWARAWVQSGPPGERKLSDSQRDVLANLWLGGATAILVLGPQGRVNIRTQPRNGPAIGQIPAAHGRSTPGGVLGVFVGGQVKPGRPTIAGGPQPEAWEQKAAAQFIGFLQSPDANRLRICNYCERFFLRQRQTKKPSDFCPACRSIGSVLRNRSIEHQKRISAARAAWERLGRPGLSRGVSLHIATRLNRARTRYELPMRTNWIVRNWPEITTGIKPEKTGKKPRTTGRKTGESQ